MKLLLITPNYINLPASDVRIFPHYRKWLDKGWDICLFQLQYSDLKENIKILKNIIGECPKNDIVYIYRSLLSNKWINEIRNASKTLVFDFDDALYCISSEQIRDEFNGIKRNIESLKKVYRKILRGNEFYSSREKKLHQTLKLCDAVVAGSTEIRKYSELFCDDVIISPTPVELEELINKKEYYGVNIGWYGKPAGYYYLKKLHKVFSDIGNKFGKNVSLKIISQPPFPVFDSINVDGVQWLQDNNYILNQFFDIGIMPLTTDCWAEGKCGYKILKYMANCIPVIASNTGFNKEIIINSVNGFLANNDNEWLEYLSELIENEKLREKIGKSGYEYVRMNCTTEVVNSKLSAFLMNVVAR
jgi:glycosyltransferase involved in cell wall biosynthesis